MSNVLDPQLLAAQAVCQLSRCRGRIAEAFLLTKRLLGLAYLWAGEVKQQRQRQRPQQAQSLDIWANALT